MTSANVKCAKNLLITSSSILQLFGSLLISSNELCNSLGIDIDIASHPSSRKLSSNSIIWNVYKPTPPIISSTIELIFGILVQRHSGLKGILMILTLGAAAASAAQLLIHHLVISAALYRSIIWTFFTNLCLHLCSVFVLLLLLLIAKRCKNTHAIFQQLSKETMQERDPSRGSPNAATKVIKTSYLWRYLQRHRSIHSGDLFFKLILRRITVISTFHHIARVKM